MPDHIEPIPSVQGQSDWPAMLRDLEKRVETLSDALEGVKLSMRRLVLSEPWVEGALERYAADFPATPTPAPILTPAPVEIPLPVGVLPPLETSKPVASYSAPVTPAEPAAVEYDDDAREAVRLAVEEARVDRTPDAWRNDDTNYVTEEQPEVSWVTVPDDGSPAEPLPDFEDDAPDVSETSYEAVRQAVEETMFEAAAESDFDAASDTTVAQPEDPREAVRRAVEEAKAELAYGSTYQTPEPAHAGPVEDEEAAREEVRRAVEAAKAEMGFASSSSPAPVTASEDEEAAREAVRQAVAEARAEIANNERSPLSALMEAPRAVERSPAFVVPPPHRPERIHPPTITIEDPEGRVELAAVYNLLKHLECAANSSLLNYSSRQVSVQLNDVKPPEGETVAEAVRDVFERENQVQVDGLNVIVKLGANYIRAA